jgi:hypothetical protein
MKIIKYSLILVSLQSFVSAASVTVDSDFTTGITNFAGTAIPNGTGSLRLGYFSTLSDVNLATLSASALLADFQTYGSDVAAFGKSGLGGFFVIEGDTGVKDFSSAFIGKNVYLMAFNQDQTQGLIYKFSELFAADPADPTPPSGQALTFTQNSSNYLLGAPGSTLQAVVVPAGRMAVLVPEPSSALLGAVGALALLRRRRK